jgi:glutamate-ammonia-ligase adenylyltransferase
MVGTDDRRERQFAEGIASRLNRLETTPEFAESAALRDVLHRYIRNTPEPERVLAQLERFLERVSSDDALRQFCLEDVRRLAMLLTLLAGSAFLSEILIRDPQLFRQWALDQSDARRRNREMVRTAVEMDRAIIRELAEVTDFEDRKLALRRFHRRELFRIAASDILGLWDMPAVTRQLSLLADALIRAALETASEKVGVVPAGLAVVGMGKLGGSELNYSSDIDLLFVAGSDAGQYNALGAATIDVLGGITSEGFLYRVDMRLRPWGGAGPLVQTVDAFLAYLERHGEDWEKQALLKARILAGNVIVGNEFIERVSGFIHKRNGDPRESVIRMKQRIESELARKGHLWGNVKQGRGSIRDVEFTVQYLQLIHGRDRPEILTQSTVSGLSELNRHGFLSGEEYRILSEGYAFLRVVEHHLQLHHNRQTHTIPRDHQRSNQLAQRLSFDGDFPGKKLIELYEQHTDAIRSVFDRIVGGADDEATTSSLQIEPHVTRMAPSYGETFTTDEIGRHAAMVRRLSHDHPLELSVDELEDGRRRITIVSYDHLGMLSIITGLLQAFGFDIIDGHIFTYEPLEGRIQTEVQEPDRQHIVDVFTVRSIKGPPGRQVWSDYEKDLRDMIEALGEGRRAEVQGMLAERIASATPRSDAPRQLYPVDITIDNQTDDRYTVLHIDAPDAIGFLYELTNALTLLEVDIARVDVSSVGERVRDTLYVSDLAGRRLTDEEDQTRIRLATVLVQHFIHLLPVAPNPTAALKQFRLLIADLFTRPDWIKEINTLERPEVLDALTRLLGVSDFLWADFLRMQHRNVFPLIEDVEGLTKHESKEDMHAQLAAEIAGAASFEDRVQVLNAFKDRSLFRIDMRYILGRITEFGAFSAELSDLAEVIVEQALEESLRVERASCGDPSFEDGGQCPLTVCALGKFGGRELGFASDIELLFIYEANGSTTGPEVVTNAEFFDRVARRFLTVIQSKRDGIFEVDLRLRPYGRSGSLAVSLAAFLRYFSLDGAAWPYERQLMVKLRPVAGDEALGQHILSIRNDILTSLGPFDVSAMRAMRERQLRHIVRPGSVNAKYSPGGLVDIEYLVQGLQVTYCNRHPELLNHRNTRSALVHLKKLGLISDDEHTALERALIFIRRVINGLRMVRGNARDLTLPAEGTQESLYLARRLEYGNPQALLPDILKHMNTVETINSKLLA